MIKKFIFSILLLFSINNISQAQYYSSYWMVKKDTLTLYNTNLIAKFGSAVFIGTLKTSNINISYLKNGYLPYDSSGIFASSSIYYVNNNVLIGTTSDNGKKLQVNGSIFLQPSNDTIGVNGTIYYDSSSQAFKIYQNNNWSNIVGFTSSGSTNYIAKWVNSSTIGTSRIVDNGSYVSVPTLLVNGGFSAPIQTLAPQSSGYLYYPAPTDFTLLCNANAYTIEIGLPDATQNTGRIFIIKKIDGNTANSVYIFPRISTQRIDGATAIGLYNQYQYVCIQSDGHNWFILFKN
jgi:hypothetical protein